MNGGGRSVGRWGVLAASALFACLSVSATVRLSAQDTIPAGFGTLRRDDIVVHFQTDQLEIQFLPLAEHVIRLLAPDTYTSLHKLVLSHQAAIDSVAQTAGVNHPTLVMVTFFGLASNARFTPEDLSVTSGGRQFRAVGILPLSPTWGGGQLSLRQQAVALYLYEDGINFRSPLLTVSYEGLDNNSWSGAVQVLERERARVLARAGSAPKN